MSAKWMFQSKCRCLKADLNYLAEAGTAMSGQNQLQEHEVFLDGDNSCMAILPCTNNYVQVLLLQSG